MKIKATNIGIILDVCDRTFCRGKNRRVLWDNKINCISENANVDWRGSIYSLQPVLRHGHPVFVLGDHQYMLFLGFGLINYERKKLSRVRLHL